MITEAIVLAGGLGTRLQPVVNGLPKSMAPVNGRPFLEYLLGYLARNGIRRVVLSVGYLHDAIRNHFGERFGTLELEYAVETEPLGTGGGIRNAFRRIRGDEAFALNGDSLFHLPLERMNDFHESGNGGFSLALRFLEETGRYGSVEMDATHRIKGFTEKKEASGPGFINGGVYILNKELLTGPLFPEKFSLEKDCFEQYYREIPMLGFSSEGFFLDIGIPEDYNKAQIEFARLEY